MSLFDNDYDLILQAYGMSIMQKTDKFMYIKFDKGLNLEELGDIEESLGIMFTGTVQDFAVFRRATNCGGIL